MRSLRFVVVAALVALFASELAPVDAQGQWPWSPPRWQRRLRFFPIFGLPITPQPPRWGSILEPTSFGTNVLTTQVWPIINTSYRTPSGVFNLRGATNWRTSSITITSILYTAGNGGVLYRSNAYYRLRGLPAYGVIGQIGPYPISALAHTVSSTRYWWGTPLIQSRLWGVAGNLEDRLVRIDWLTGAGTLIGTFGTTGGGTPIRDIESMTRTRNGRSLIGATGFGFDGTPGDFFRINQLTGKASYMGSLTHAWTGQSLVNELTGISWSSSGFRGRLYGVLGNGNAFRRGWVIFINLNTMTFTYRGDATPTGGAASGFAFIHSYN